MSTSRISSSVDAPAEIGRERADGGADRERDRGCDDADEQAQPQAVENSGEHVAALVVGAEQIEPARRSRARAGGSMLSMIDSWREVVGILRRDPGREEREHDQQRRRRRAPTTAMRLSANSRQASASARLAGVRGVADAGCRRAAPCSRLRSGEANARIEQRIDHVDDEIDHARTSRTTTIR